MKHKPAFPKPKKVSKSSLKRKADILFSKAIRSIGVCEMAPFDTIRCGGVLQCCHLIGRANLRLRYDDKNAISMCAGHHTYYTYHPLEWFIQLQENFAPYWEYIMEHRNEKVKPDYEKIIGSYQNS